MVWSSQISLVSDLCSCRSAPCSRRHCHFLGLSDVNQTRKKTTNDYIRACEAALLVAPIARVETDSRVHKRLGTAHRMFGNKKALVVTKIDASSQIELRYLSIPTKRFQETRGLNRPMDLEPTQEAAKEYERLLSAGKSTTQERTRLVSLRNTAKGKSNETLTQHISKLRSVVPRNFYVSSLT